MWLRCQFHAHTTNSDGETSPAALCDHYADLGFDVLAITDHWHVTDVDHDRIIVIPSSELTADAPSAHDEAEVLALGVAELPEVSEPFPDIEALAAWIVEQGGVPFLCHPYWSGLRAEDVLAAPSLAGIEIWNGGSEVLQGNGLSTVHWDDALQQGRLLTGLATDDCHSPGRGQRLRLDLGAGAGAIGAAAVIDALRRGRFYASAGPMLRDVAIDGGVGRRCAARRRGPCAFAPGRGTAAPSTPSPGWATGVARRASATATGSSRRPASSFPEFWRWARVEVEDERGRRAWSNPFVLPGELAGPGLRRAPRMPAPRAVLFDFNGTLSQDEPLLLRIYQSLFARYGKPLGEEEYLGRLAGLTEEAIIGGWLGVDGPLLGSLVAERIDAYVTEAADGATVTEEVRAAVRYAAERVPVGIVSGAFRAEIEPVVAAAGLPEQITAIVAADDVEHGKPHPEGYLRALESVGLDAADVVAFEDTEAGVAAAKAAGLSCIAVRGTLPDDRLAAADELVDAIDVELLQRLLARGEANLSRATACSGMPLARRGELLRDDARGVRVDVLAQDLPVFEREDVDAVPGQRNAARMGRVRRPLLHDEVGADVGCSPLEAEVGPVREDRCDVVANRFPLGALACVVVLEYHGVGMESADRVEVMPVPRIAVVGDELEERRHLSVPLPGRFEPVPDGLHVAHTLTPRARACQWSEPTICSIAGRSGRLPSALRSRPLTRLERVC